MGKASLGSTSNILGININTPAPATSELADAQSAVMGLSFFAQGARPLEALALRGRTCARLDHLRGLCDALLCDRVLRNVIVHSPALCPLRGTLYIPILYQCTICTIQL